MIDTKIIRYPITRVANFNQPKPILIKPKHKTLKKLKWGCEINICETLNESIEILQKTNVPIA